MENGKRNDFDDPLYLLCRELIMKGHRMRSTDREHLLRTIQIYYKTRQQRGDDLPRMRDFFNAKANYGKGDIASVHAWITAIMVELKERYEHEKKWGW